MRDTYYITTPIYYVNDAPHIGHAYTTLACDVIARFMRLDGKQVKFLTGTDEHGAEGGEVRPGRRASSPKAFTDKVSQNFRDLAKAMNFSNDDFIRTTEERHLQSCQELWRRLIANDQIYLGKYAGWYAVARRSLLWRRMNCATKAARRSRRRAPNANGWRSPATSSGSRPGRSHCSNFMKRIRTSWRQTSRRNEVISFVKSGLNDLSVSRTTFSWGIPVPDDPKHIMYVWLDALTNYITAAGFPDIESADYKSFWPADLHMVGQGYSALSRHLLAGLSDGRQTGAAAARIRPWLVDERGPEDLEVARQCHRSARIG